MGVAAEPAGFFVSLLTESFAVRALLGSLAAIALAAVAVRTNVLRSTRARRSVVLVPLVVAALAAFVTILGTGGILAQDYLPRIWVTVPSAASGQVLELLGEARVLAEERGLDILSLLWLFCATVLVGRRAAGLRAVRRLLRRSIPAPSDHPVLAAVERVRADLGAPRVAVRLLERCPGGAFTTGVFRRVVVFDPILLAGLDDAEVEGLVAHELAHVVRRDPLLAGVVGLLADLAFFVPTLSIAARWLGREQEHSADDLASTVTNRPAALASSILKVSHRATGQRHPLGACAAVPKLAGVGGWTSSTPRLSDAARVVVARIERLVDPPAVTSVRRFAEMTLVGATFVTAVVATFVLPSWIADRLDMTALGLSYVPTPAPAVESPAFATFRALTPQLTATTPRAPEERVTLPPRRLPVQPPATCPCVETQAQLLGGDVPAPPTQDGAMRWRQSSASPYDLAGPDTARPLWTFDSAPGVGFFAVPRDVEQAEEPATRSAPLLSAPRA